MGLSFFMSLRLLWRGLRAGLPGDDFEQADANDEREGKRENDGPGVGGDASAWGGHGGVSLEKAVQTRIRVGYGFKFSERGEAQEGLATTTAG
jgi:hypothetical protein